MSSICETYLALLNCKNLMMSLSVIGCSIGPFHWCLSDPLQHSMNTKLVSMRLRELRNLPTYNCPTEGPHKAKMAEAAACHRGSKSSTRRRIASRCSVPCLTSCKCGSRSGVPSTTQVVWRLSGRGRGSANSDSRSLAGCLSQLLLGKDPV
jgi:hypothetical protein